MPADSAFLITLAAGFGLALLFGLVAVRLRVPPLVGYLLAGVLLGPFTPGFVADVHMASQLAEVGVVLLMFGVGVHFSPGDLLGVRKTAVPGAVAQIAIAAALGALVSRSWGWDWGAALVFGTSLSVASTVVVLRVLEERGLLDSVQGRTTVGWLIVEDLAMVVALVLLPVIAGALQSGALGDTSSREALAALLVLTVAKVTTFLVVMILVGRRAVPWLLTRVARSGSRELFTLAVLVIALGVAVGAAMIFGVSLALGAFLAGVVISESDLSYKAAADALPLQDAFAVLFFVSVGMLFDPGIVVREPMRVVATVLVILFGNAAAALALLVLLGHRLRSALLMAASLGQIGEFSFIVAGLGVTLGLLPAEGRSLVLAGALLTIVLNPLLFLAVGRADAWLQRHPDWLDRLERRDRSLPIVPDSLPPSRQHAIIVGYGRVGSAIGHALADRGIPFMVVEQDRRTVEELRRQGVPAIYGDATRPGILDHARPAQARLLVVAAPDPYHARRIVSLAREANPGLDVVVRTHRREEQQRFEQIGVGRAVMGEHELALGMADYALRSLGCDDDQRGAAISALRAEQ